MPYVWISRDDLDGAPGRDVVESIEIDSRRRASVILGLHADSVRRNSLESPEVRDAIRAHATPTE